MVPLVQVPNGLHPSGFVRGCLKMQIQSSEKELDPLLFPSIFVCVSNQTVSALLTESDVTGKQLE